MTTREQMARLSASEVACYRWPEDTTEHRAMRAAFCDGAALAAKSAPPSSSADYHQRRGAAWDIIDEALDSYDKWIRDDDFEFYEILKRIMHQLRERRELYRDGHPSVMPDSSGADGKWWRQIETAPDDGGLYLYGLTVTNNRTGHKWFEVYYLARDDDGSMVTASGDHFSEWSHDDFEVWATPPDAPPPHDCAGAGEPDLTFCYGCGKEIKGEAWVVFGAKYHEQCCSSVNRAAADTTPVIPASPDDKNLQIWLLAGRLAGAELNYRNCYEQYGPADTETVRAWDKMRSAGDAIRALDAWEVPASPDDELAQWKQAAGVEAGLRREFLARAEKAEAELASLRMGTATEYENETDNRSAARKADKSPSRTVIAEDALPRDGIPPSDDGHHLSTPMGTATREVVDDAMVERAWAAIVGADIARACISANLTRGDLKTGLRAALSSQAGVREQTIEECAKVADIVAAETSDGDGEFYIAREIAATIRALPQQQPSEGERDDRGSEG